MMLMLLALLLTPAALQEPGVVVQLLFDGKPLQTTARPQFSCRDDTRNTWIGQADQLRRTLTRYEREL
jgi:hypothetical protein